MSDVNEHITNGSIFALALAFVKAIEHLFVWLSKKSKKESEKRVIVELSAEPSRMLRETYENVININKIIDAKDANGVPLTYVPRSLSDDHEDLAAAVRDISNQQDKIADKQEEIADEVKQIARDVNK